MAPGNAKVQTVSEIYELLRLAAVRRQAVSAIYDGRPRLLCPHVLGRKSGRLHALFYQFGGSSNSGLPVAPEGVGDWRCGQVHGTPNDALGDRPALMKWISMPTLSPKKIRSRGNAAGRAAAGAPG